MLSLGVLPFKGGIVPLILIGCLTIVLHGDLNLYIEKQMWPILQEGVVSHLKVAIQLQHYLLIGVQI